MCFFAFNVLCSVKMAYGALQIEGRVLSCQSKPNDNIRLQKKYVMVLYILFVHANFWSEHL